VKRHLRPRRLIQHVSCCVFYFVVGPDAPLVAGIARPSRAVILELTHLLSF
jgi:hypothetical protein